MRGDGTHPMQRVHTGIDIAPDLLPPTRPPVTTWHIEERTHGLKRWQVTRRDRGPGYTGVTAWRFAERYQAERYAMDVLGVAVMEMTR